MSLLATLVLVSVAAHPALGQNPDFAKDLAEEGVVNEAKIEFVRVLHDPSKKQSYAEAHYYLGYLSYREKNYDRALAHWNALLKEYPTSPYAEKARNQVRLAALLLSKQQESQGETLEISGLFDNAEFLIGRPLKVTIDTSYLSTGDLAIQSLEEIVKKFPNSPDAPLALFREALIYYGWGERGIGEDSSPDGYGFVFCHYYSRDRKQEQVYIQKMVDVFSRLDQQYPDSALKVPVAFLIGQAYWSLSGGKGDANAQTYWNKVVSLTEGDTASTYREIAEKRLNGR